MLLPAVLLALLTKEIVGQTGQVGALLQGRRHVAHGLCLAELEVDSLLFGHRRLHAPVRLIKVGRLKIGREASAWLVCDETQGAARSLRNIHSQERALLDFIRVVVAGGILNGQSWEVGFLRVQVLPAVLQNCFVPRHGLRHFHRLESQVFEIVLRCEVLVRELGLLGELVSVLEIIWLRAALESLRISLLTAHLAGSSENLLVLIRHCLTEVQSIFQLKFDYKSKPF